MMSKIRPGRIGQVEVSVFEVGVDDAAWAQAHGGSVTVPGTYTRLQVGTTIRGSDTPMDQHAAMRAVENAAGRVLLGGLGLGLTLPPILALPNVDHVLVLEPREEVIDLVSPAFQDALDVGRLFILHEDISVFTPEVWEKWDTIYFDVWPSMEPADPIQVATLTQKFRPFLAPNGWMAHRIYEVG